MKPDMLLPDGKQFVSKKLGNVHPADAGDILALIPYGLAVTLEVTENSLFPVPIYEEVREHLAVRVSAQESGRV